MSSSIKEKSKPIGVHAAGFDSRHLFYPRSAASLLCRFGLIVDNSFGLLGKESTEKLQE